MDSTSERNLAVITHGPLMIELMIVPISEKSQIIYYCFLAFFSTKQLDPAACQPVAPRVDDYSRKRHKEDGGEDWPGFP